METESIKLNFTDDSIAEISEMATIVNDRMENIGARRLHTIMERILDDISFDAPDMIAAGGHKEIVIDAKYVRDRLSDIIKDEDLSRYIL